MAPSGARERVNTSRVRFGPDERLGAERAVLRVTDARDAPLYLQHVKLDVEETTWSAPRRWGKASTTRAGLILLGT